MRTSGGLRCSHHIISYVLLNFDLVIVALDPGGYWMVRKDLNAGSRVTR